ncbi:hypothetical protein BOH78_1567 [Pichia kudriavzevii]|uniref:Uncharacterized protein n=1 Tax=Pichia kudriavzevii TaxID=4909 RepID=A0A1V2LT93_PICKU|nr:hypothetical protein BOH78_1567 [Pichia kudriavzevii]
MEEALERLEIQLEEVKQMNEKGKTESLELNHIDDMAKEDFNITPSLERVGVSIPSFMMPNMEMLSPSNVSRRFNEYAHAVNMEHSSSSHIAEMLGDLINRRTSELKNLYSDVSESLADVLNTNIDHPIDEYISEIQSDENSPATRDNETMVFWGVRIIVEIVKSNATNVIGGIHVICVMTKKLHPTDWNGKWSNLFSACIVLRRNIQNSFVLSVIEN